MNYDASFSNKDIAYPNRPDPRSPSLYIGKENHPKLFSLSVQGKDFRIEEQEPPWMKEYWARKSSGISPDGTTIDDSKAFRRVTLGTPGRSYSWSPPGGKAIVYIDIENENIYIMSDDGREKRKIAGEGYILPAWSNDGKKIAFLSDTSFMGTMSSMDSALIESRDCNISWYIYIVELSGIEYQDRK